MKKRSSAEILSLAGSTCGVGYFPIAPGTWGSLLAVVLYLGVRFLELSYEETLVASGVTKGTFERTLFALNLFLVLIVIAIGIWAADRTVKILDDKDPSKVVVDEVMGQFITFLFLPLSIGLGWVFAGFLLFRLLDIWKPYPINSLQNLPGGIGVCADDILAGIYAGIILLVARTFSG